MTPIAPTPSTTEKVTSFMIKWTPRAIVVLVGGYYGLGIAYEFGLMASVDKVSIYALKYFFGYAGIGAFMPTAQWYSAIAVRCTIGFSAGIVYDLTERCVKYCWNKCHREPAFA